jgi:hypothetical protein
MSQTRILRGDGGSSCPYVVNDIGGEKIISPTIKVILEECDRHGITKLKYSMSGRYIEKREDGGWYETSDTDQCDKFYGLPPEGRLKIKM